MAQAAALVAQLAAAGTPPELLAAVAQELFLAEAERTALTERRRNERERKARSRDVTGQGVTDADPCLDKKVSHTLQKIKPNQVPPYIPPIMAAWNDMSACHKLTQIQGIAGKRRKAVAARIDEHGLDGVLKAISAVPKSDHWLGANGWKGNFDSLMRPEHCQRMIELADQANHRQPSRTAEEWEDQAEFYDRIGMNDNAEECRRKAAALRKLAA